MKRSKTKGTPKGRSTPRKPKVFRSRFAMKVAAYGMIMLGMLATLISGVISVSYAMGIAWFVVVAFALAELGELIIPVVGGLHGWDRHMKITFAVCMIASSYSIVSGLYDVYSPIFVKTATDKAITSQATGELERANATLARLQPLALGSAGELKTAAKQASAAAEKAEHNASGADVKAATERQDVSCGKLCREHEEDARRYRTEAASFRASAQDFASRAAMAEDRDAALAIASQAKTDRAAHVVEHEKNASQMSISFVLALAILKLFPFFSIKGMELLAKATEVKPVRKEDAWKSQISELVERTMTEQETAVFSGEVTAATWATPDHLAHMAVKAPMIEGHAEPVLSLEAPAKPKRAPRPRKPRAPKITKTAEEPIVIEGKKAEKVGVAKLDRKDGVVVFHVGGKKKLH